MLYPLIKKLYMYKPPDAYTLDILINGRLWASKPERFNDPFDCDLEIEKDITEESVLEAARRWRNESQVAEYKTSKLDANGKFTIEERKRLNEIVRNFEKENKNSGVVCLSEVCDSILMWSHYAQNHKGVCFEFTRAENNYLGDEERCSPVRYERHYPPIDLGQMLINQDGETIRLMMKTKSWEWAYEKEWRLITDCGDKEYPLSWPISRVILGVRIEKWFKSCIETLCKERNIQYVQAKKSDREFRIEIT